MKLKVNNNYYLLYKYTNLLKMTNYQFIFPIQTDFYITFENKNFSKFLIVNFFHLDENKGLIIDENNNKHIFDIKPFNIDWNNLYAGNVIGNQCVNFIKQFYPKKEVKFITSRTVSNDGTIKNEPEYFLFFGLN